MPEPVAPLDHLVFERVPDKEPVRRGRPYHPPRLPARDDEHGSQLVTQALEAAEKVSSARKTLEVTADRLLVLELTSYDVGTREQIERLGAAVVEERRLPDEKWGLVVQFPDQGSLARFTQEASAFRKPSTGMLPIGARDKLLESTESVHPVSNEERKGLRLLQQGFPKAEEFFLDVDLWHPGDAEQARKLLEDLRALCNRLGGRVTDDGRTPTLLIARVHANIGLGEALLSWDQVARIEVPSQPFVPQQVVFASGTVPTDIDPAPASAPLAGLLDSGVLAGHPALQGSIYSEEDLGSGEATPVDLHGHGTEVAGQLVFGDVGECIRSGDWTPRVRIASGKVLGRDKTFPDEAPVFAEGVRPEHALENAIRRMHSELGCRVFNISIGDFTPYAGGRQTPCAELLDKLARELNVVFIVAAGNVATSSLPSLPGKATAEAAQKAMLVEMAESASQRVSDPATSALAITVGALSRSGAIEGSRRRVPATPLLTPAVFSRIGPGYSMLAPTGQAGVKPEFVAPAGNFALEPVAGALRWVTNDNGLREPSLRLPSKGGFLGFTSGTSIAAPQVAHTACLALDALGRAGSAQSANAVRALLGASAEAIPSVQTALEQLKETEGKDWSVGDMERRFVGYGMCSPRCVSGSADADTVLLAEDSLVDDRWHVYEIPVPESFLTVRGKRSLSVALAFDPPTRSSRRMYLARTFSFYVVKGLELTALEKYLSKPPQTPKDAKQRPGTTTSPAGAAEKRLERLPRKYCLDLEPSRTAVGYSTLQVRRRTWTRQPELSETLHVVVVSQSRFDLEGDSEKQPYALAVRLAHSDTAARIYETVKARARIRTRARIVTRA